MMRVYNEVMQRVLLILLHYRYSMGATQQQALEYCIGNWYRAPARGAGNVDPVVHRVVRNLLDVMPGLGNENTTELIETIAKQLAGTGVAHHGDLIDTVADALKQPFGRNGFDSRTLNRLREAILTPDELVSVRAKIREKELKCGACDHIFVTDEMITPMIDRDGTTLFCRKCRPPQFVVCSHCGEIAEFDRSLARAIGREISCGCVKPGQKQPEAEVVADVLNPAQRERLRGRADIDTVRRTLRQEADRLRAQQPGDVIFGATTTTNAAGAVANPGLPRPAPIGNNQPIVQWQDMPGPAAPPPARRDE